jgi:integrase
MQFYTDFTGLSPSELLEEAEREQIGESSIQMRKRKINDRLLDFRDYLESRDIAPMTIATRIKAINSFYKYNYIQIPLPSRSDKRVQPLPEHKVIPTKENIRSVLAIADPLERAMILVGASSGLAIADICNLKICDFKKGSHHLCLKVH